LEDNKTLSPDRSLSALHQRLRDRTAAWDTLNWKQKEDLPIFFGPWEFVAGILVTSQSEYHTKSTTFVFKQPSSYYSLIPDKTWTVHLDNVCLHDFAIDPSQDLLIVAEDTFHLSSWACNLHILSMSTGKSHPLATSQLIEYRQVLPPFRIETMKFQIQGTLCGVLFADLPGRGELALWNWKTGKLHKRIRGAILAFAFLTSELVLFAAVSSEDADEAPSLNIIELQLPSSDAVETDVLSTDYVCGLAYPPIRTLPHVVPQMEIRTDPPPMTPHSALFSTSNSNRLFVVSCVTMHWCIVLAIPLSTFLSKVRQCQSSARAGWQSRRLFAFNQWGSSGSRMFFRQPSDIWICYVHGLKFSILNETGTIMHVYDFNPLALGRAKMYPNSAATLTQINETASTSSLDSEIFLTPVTTSLPFRLVTAPVPSPSAEALMIGENCIVVVCSVDGEFVFRILSF
jgi:hypothetical protein